MPCVRYLEHEGMMWDMKQAIEVDMAWFIVKNKGALGHMSMDELMGYARIWNEWQKHGCQYAPEVMEVLHQMHSSLESGVFKK